MAGPTTRRGRASAVKTTSSISNDGTLVDTSLSDTPVSGDGLDQHDNSGIATPAESVHDEITPLGADVLKALQVVSKLEQLGLDKQEISLPKCIVLGQQSAGKSSVIEAISGIKTPRDTGTCTRCPLFIELQPSADPRDTWNAKVCLMRQYEFKPDRRQNGIDTEFEGWAPLPVPTMAPFAETNNPGELEHLIRCAQRATLSPLENPQSSLDASFDDRGIHKSLFSPNVVCISVSMPGIPPLSFYDLPGVISFAENDEEEFTVDLVKKLVTKYIKDQEALILLTCPLETDVANSVAAGLATRANVKDRCLGVLTKPDRLPVGESPQYLASILEGRHFAMGHGYFVVKNLNSDQIRQGMTHLDARQLEQRFFSEVAPWSTAFQAYQPRFGTVNLQKYLSAHLGNQVLSKLPLIRRQIEERLDAVEAELDRIPEIPLHTAARTVDDVIHRFADQVRSEMAGDHGFTTWRNTWDDIQQNMWDMLSQLKPTMLTAGEHDAGLFDKASPGCSADMPVDISDDDEDVSPAPETPSKKRKQNLQPKRETQTPAPGPSPFRTPKKPTTRPARRQNTNVSSAQTNNIAALKETFNLDHVTRYISHSSKSRVPGQINTKVREEMMLSPLEHWPKVVEKFFDELEHQLKQHMLALFKTQFNDWKGAKLYTESYTVLENLLNNNLHEQRTVMASESLDEEREGPYIFHQDIFQKDKAATMDRGEPRPRVVSC
ncbi:hypothetical protein OPT61_g8219 [Boeremia exigua]|uniref:Uncharacterized protein n=1 Tax=Boeremia exigua TaxID=749465 RepID=A0ACC2HZ45_9PLEO|nr:hypothetical protein OPT61_g8219 [Boeremia exigua]